MVDYSIYNRDGSVNPDRYYESGAAANDFRDIGLKKAKERIKELEKLVAELEEQIRQYDKFNPKSGVHWT